jgi:hypothetical protein
MLAATTQKEDNVVKTGIINWASHSCNETTFGYASAGPFSMISASMYARMSDTDFRKKMFKAPAGSVLSGSEKYINAALGKTFPAYSALKFRPNNGELSDYTIAAATAFPMMRVEEMYFIEAEAAEHVSAGTGIALLTDFMKQYRDPAYAFKGGDAIDEIVFQKRVELWGEGHTFFDIKRLNMSVTRGYDGTNWQDTQSQLNTNGRPAWTNYVIVRTEAANNTALVNFNNPDPSDAYAPWAAN